MSTAEFALRFALMALAIYRVAVMLATEDGPFDIFSRLRWAVGQKSWVGRGLHCALCLSFWFGFIGAAFLPFAAWADYIATALALSAITVLLRKVAG